MRYAPWLISCAVALAAPARGADQAPPEALENDRVRLEFNARTGAWTGLVDRRDGMQLVVPGGRGPIVPTPRRPLDPAKPLPPAGNSPRVDLAGDWLYTPKPVPTEAEPALVAGRFDAAAWAPTPVPSRPGAGDDRLRDRVGDFWYRRDFATPAGNGEAEDLALLIGAVDDFDVAYLNGTRIGRTGQDTPHHWETPRFYPFPARLLRADGPNTLLLKVSNGSGEGGIAVPVVVGTAASLAEAVDDATPAPAVSLTQRGRNADAALLAFTANADRLDHRVEWTLPDQGARFERRLVVINRDDRERLYQVATYETPPLRVGADPAILFPGSLPAGDIPASGLMGGDSVRPRSDEPLVVLWDEAGRRGVGSWFASEDEFSPVTVARADGGLRIRHAQQVIVRLQPGASVTLGTEHFWLAHGSRTDAIAGVQDAYRSIGLRAPDRAVPGLASKVMYCGHPGGPPELGYRTYGGFPAVERYLPTLQALGIDLLWFLPIWEHGDGIRWNLYSPFDHFQVSPLYGSADDLRGLSARAAERGMRLVFDLVPHGPPDVSPLAKEHPEYAALGPDGKPIYAWLQLAFDNAHPGWQDYFLRVAEHDARAFDALGARVDCAAGGPLNWNPAATDRPSRSSLAAGLGMTRAVRAGFLRARPDTLIIPEEYTGANIYSRVADLTYDAQFYFLMAELQGRAAPPEDWARTLQRFLHDQQAALPPGALKMRWISNHDTVSWTFQKKRPLDVYGVGRVRALLAVCALIEGVPMLYQGDEDPAVYGGKGPSSVDFLAKLYATRKAEPALREGRADYDSIHASGGVFACLRSGGDRTAIVLVNFSDGEVETTLTTTRTALPAGPWRDVLGGEEVRLGGSVAMAPHQVRVLVRPGP